MSSAIDHAETISPANIARVKALGGGIAIQSRMAYAGEYATLAPELPPVAPEWSPVARFGGHWSEAQNRSLTARGRDTR